MTDTLWALTVTQAVTVAIQGKRTISREGRQCAMDANLFSMENIKKTSPCPKDTGEKQLSRSSQTQSHAVKLAGMLEFM